MWVGFLGAAVVLLIAWLKAKEEDPAPRRFANADSVRQARARRALREAIGATAVLPAATIKGESKPASVGRTGTHATGVARGSLYRIRVVSSVGASCCGGDVPRARCGRATSYVVSPPLYLPSVKPTHDRRGRA